MKILTINGGAAYQIEAVERRWHSFFDCVIRPEEIAATPLEEFDAVLVLCRTPAYRLQPHAPRLRHYLERGGTVIAMGECHSERWLPNIKFEACETNFWWWLEEGADLGVKITKPEHTLFQRLQKDDVSWHLHGFFTAPNGAEILLTAADNRSILYIDEVSVGGRMIITSLDPFFHDGHHFMPATTRFLRGFLPWLKHDLLSKLPLTLGSRLINQGKMV